MLDSNGDVRPDGLDDPDRVFGTVETRTSHTSGVELELESLDFDAFVAMVLGPLADTTTEP